MIRDLKFFLTVALGFLLIFASFVYDAFGQGSALVRSCAGTGLTIKQAKLEVTKDGDINIVPCDARSVLLRGLALNGTGTVQSIGLSLPNIFTVSGSPITSAGTLTATFANQNQNLIFASPNGATGTPIFRALSNADLPNLDASKVTTGVFSSSIIPTLDTSKITTGTFDAARIPNLDASKITTGSFSASQIPNLDTSKITTGSFSASQIPNLDASKITVGTVSTARLGTGTADSTTFLRGDNTWQTISNSLNYPVEQLNTATTAINQTEFINLTTVTAQVVQIPTMTVGQHYTFFNYNNGQERPVKLTQTGGAVLMGQSGNYYGAITASNSIKCLGVFRIYKVEASYYYLDAPAANCTVTP